MSGDCANDGGDWAVEPLLAAEACDLKWRELLVYFPLQIASLREYRVHDDSEAVAGLQLGYASLDTISAPNFERPA